MGLDFPSAYIISKQTETSFRLANFRLYFNAGVDLGIYPNNSKYHFSIGWNSSSIGYGFRFRSPNGGLHAHFTGLTVHRIPFGFEKNIMKVRWIYSEKKAKIIGANHSDIRNEDIVHNLKFNMKMLGGFDINYFPRMTDEGTTYSVFRDYRDLAIDYALYHNSTYHSRRVGYGLFAGICFQFYGLTNEHLRLTLLYSQGIRQVGTVDMNYGFIYGSGQNDEYTAKIGFRGSFISASLGCPIFLRRKNSAK
jgi:hypothetical protein